MDWKLFVQLGVTLVVAVGGGWLGHHLSLRRDLTNERRRLRTTYLLEAYRKLESAANRRDLAVYFPALESSVADIQLLGSPYQVSLIRKLAEELDKERQASLDELLFDLRQSLRSELELENDTHESRKMTFLRF